MKISTALALWVLAAWQGQTAGVPLVADYPLDSNLESVVPGAPSLLHLGTNHFSQEVVDGQSRTVLVFGRNDGLALPAAGLLDAPEGYTLVVLFRFEEVFGRRRILDFKQATSDTGLYSAEGVLTFHNQAAGSAATIGAGPYVQVVLSRGADRWVNGYVDGVWQFAFFDVSGLALPGSGAVLRLFRDEDPVSSGEASAGAVARLRVYRGVMDSGEVATLDRLPGGPDGKIQFEQPEVAFSESSGLISVWVVRSGPAGFPASVQWSVVGGTASLPDDVDLVHPGGTLVFAPGETRKDIQLPIVQDQQPEGDETVILSLHNPVGAGLGEPFLAVVTILDDDSSQGVSADLSLLKWADSDIAPVGQPVQFTVQLQNFGPDPVSGLVVEDPLPAEVQLAGWNVSPDTTFEATKGRWSVPTLAPGAMVLLELSLVRSSPGTLDNHARIVSPAVNDPTPEDHEAWATGHWEPVASNAVLEFETAALSVSERAGLVAVRVLRRGDTNGLSTVRYSVSGGTATPGVDFLPPPPGDLVFAPGAAWSDLFLVVLDDALVEGDETVELTLHDPTGASLGTPTNCVVTLLDDDLPPLAEADLSLFKWAETNLAPAGQPIRFVVALQSAGPAASSNVVVQEELPPGTVLAGWTAAPGTAFNPTNGQWTLPFVGPGTTNLLLLDLVRTNAGLVTNVAYVLQASHPDPTLTDRTNSATAGWVAQDVTDLALGLRLQTNLVGVGQTVIIQMVVTNLGPREASNITVLAPVPPGTELVRIPAFQLWSFDPPSGRLQRPFPLYRPLWVDEGSFFEMEVRATNIGTFPVTAQILASEPPDSVAANNAASNTLTVVRFFQLSGSVRCGGTNGPALAAVTVTLAASNAPPRSVVTGADGTFAFSNLIAGPYTLSASTNGYSFNPPHQTVDLQTTTNLPPFVATPRFVVAEVRAGGSAVPGIAVQLTGPAAAQGLTDAAGRAVFTNLNPGVYVLTPLTNGQPAARFHPTNVTVTLGQPTNCDTTARFALTSRAVVLRALEVNQAIQDWENSVPLIQSKSTVARAHLQLPDGVTNPVPVAGARLRGFRNGTELAIPGGGFGLSPINPGGSLTLAHTNAADQAVRERFGGSLNFRLPDLWTHGALELRFEWTNGVVIPREPAEAGGRAGDAAVRLAFLTNVPPVQVDFYKARYTHRGVTNEPTSTAVDDLIRRLEAIYPMFRRSSTYHSLPLDFVPDTTNLHQVNARLAAARLTNGRGGDHPRRLAYGVIVGTNDVGGEALGIPGDVSCGSLRTGGYGHYRHAHEIGHSLGRPHAANAANFGVSGGFARGACGEFADTNAPAFPYFWRLGGRMFARLGPMDQGDDKLVYGLNTREGALFYQATPNPTNVLVISPYQTGELMSYCRAFTGWRWISKYSYTNILQALIARFQPPPARGAKQMPRPASEPQDYLLIRGWIDLESGAASWLPFQLAHLFEPPEGPAPGPFTLRLLDGTGQLLADIPFAPDLHQPDDPAEHSAVASFLIPVPFAVPVAEVVLFHEANPLASRRASASLPVVQVLTPNGGETLGGAGPWLVQWEGHDPDGDVLTYLVQYSPDEGATWRTLAIDWKATALEIFPEDLPGSTAGGRLRVIASDGFRVNWDASDAPFTVANRPPRLALRLPPAGETFSRDQQVLFEAEALDPEDGPLPDERLVWHSSRDGVLGTGRFWSREATAFSEGVHEITVTATDLAGLSQQATVSIEIAREPRPRLSARMEGSRVILSWDSLVWDYQLEAATRLRPADWQVVPEPVTLIEDRWTVEVEADQATRFFRLRRP